MGKWFWKETVLYEKMLNKTKTKEHKENLFQNLTDFLVHHKKRKISKARKYLEATKEWVDYIKEYYNNPKIIEKIKNKLWEAYDEYGKRWIPKDEYINKTIQNLQEWLKKINVELVNKNSRRIAKWDEKVIEDVWWEKNILWLLTESSNPYLLNTKKLRMVDHGYWDSFIKSESVHEADHYTQYLLFNYWEDYPFSEIGKIYDGIEYNKNKVNPLYLYLEKRMEWLFWNRKTFSEEVIGNEIYKKKKDERYETNVLEILSRIRQLKMARLEKIDDNITEISLRNDKLFFNPENYKYPWEILSQIKDKQKFIDFVNDIR